jgi:methylmalonyl-CoA mutase N-terminal domain/subunit
MGGMVAAIERGYPQREIADASYRYQVAVDRKEKIIVGVNEFVGEEKPIEILQIDESVREQQAKHLRKLRAERSNDEVARRIESPAQSSARNREPDAAHLRCGKSLRHARRNLRRALREVSSAPSFSVIGKRRPSHCTTLSLLTMRS